ncbi:hypothetical protein G7B40_002445 [Aetokthonos hydrillicola Thurmond2011]|jgi:hypothetical protein|uniref:PEP-CTERM protein-sorting domain-containing protein n=1 Tax=Aetokthonos hydrillicola Thurmond2011 TaxID=2712845 RepID=A0AAP5M8D1_9CYAN|nr:hypothetical protein [Aetokthonos hydrillicola]MBO3464357.1 hypothetical protein [Aetokthonos hydrillicola CCALA 1050]MBW4588134.1 hypothetical protein [Aetokthonos hydrillicola CCALA 1050]MDR9893448.1 hypothetical protein [Aetokthonos hydrillicola Thurmond2011]
MKQHLGFAKRILLLVTPLVSSSVLAPSSSQAATLASSVGQLQFPTFSQSPVDVGTGVSTNTLTTARNGLAIATSQATASFIATPPEASNFSISEAFGQGRDYLAQAESQATVLGDFVVDAGKQFSFDFAAQLNLKTSIDNPPQENARASGDISFVLLDRDTNSVLDFFTLVGNLNTEGGGDFLATQKSNDINLSILSKDSNFGGQQEFATASVKGSVQRSFDRQTNLALVEVKRNRAEVRAPEPSTRLALLLGAGLVSVALKSRRKTSLNLKSQSSRA